jgi:glycogen debranching enzyme
VSDLLVLDGCTFFYTDATGDVHAREAKGYFFEDVRHLSRWQLLLDEQPLECLASRSVDYFSARMVCAPPGQQPPVTVRRDRFVTDGVHEDVIVRNHCAEPIEVKLELHFGADFADVLEAQQGGESPDGEDGHELEGSRARMWHQRNGYRRETIVAFSRRDVTLEEGRAVFDLRLGPHEEWKTCVDVVPVVDGRKRRALLRCESFGKPEPEMPLSLQEWLAGAPALDTDEASLVQTYRQSLLDLGALRIRPTESLAHAMPAGGLPWFMTAFGRDSLVTSYFALPFQPTLAEATLQALAELQATEYDDFRDAEPGKIMHELRRGTLARSGVTPHSPYYGTHDATLLFLIALDEYERWTGDTALVRRLEGAARAAVSWLEGPADLDGDGFLEYHSRSSKGLVNLCWKDSDDSILFPDGTHAEAPIATCEIQGYAYDARLRTARLAREVWGDAALAERLERDAAALRERFDEVFWLGRRRFYALALDGQKRPVGTLTSNIGHLLWSGIVPVERAEILVRRLLGKDMFSGWGIRTMSTRERPYSPLRYHDGTVWPHDTAIVAEGMRRYGFRDEASRVAHALLDAARQLDHRLPEVFSGFERDGADVPVDYPGAMTPQAWSAAAPLLALRTLLGLDVVDGELRTRRKLPRELRGLRLRGIPFRGGRRDVP